MGHLPPDDDDEPEIILSGFDPELPPPTLAPETNPRASLVGHQEELDRREAKLLQLRVTELEGRVRMLEAEIEVQARDQTVKQARLLRRYIKAWLIHDRGTPSDMTGLLRQWREFRKFLAVWIVGGR